MPEFNVRPAGQVISPLSNPSIAATNFPCMTAYAQWLALRANKQYQGAGFPNNGIQNAAFQNDPTTFDTGINALQTFQNYRLNQAVTQVTGGGLNLNVNYAPSDPCVGWASTMMALTPQNKATVYRTLGMAAVTALQPQTPAPTLGPLGVAAPDPVVVISLGVILLLGIGVVAAVGAGQT